MTTDKKGSLTILVTGINGYVAGHVTDSLLNAGYKVRGTVRSESSIQKVKKAYPDHHDRLSLVVVPDITVPGAFDEAVQGVAGIMHVASPFTREASDFENDFLIPAIKGTTTILEAASLSPSVQRVIVTSSFAAMLDMSRGLRPGYTYSEADFNPETYEGAKACESAGWAYCASKGLAEKAAWKYLEDHKPHFTLSVINPPKIIGPSIQELSMSSLCTSMKDIYPLINGSLAEVPKTTVWGWVDVRDVGIAHLRALELPEAINKRFLLTEGTYTFQNICDILRDSPKIPDSVKAKIPLGSPGQDNAGPHVYDLDNSRSKKVLGMQYRTLEESVVDTALNLLASE